MWHKRSRHIRPRLKRSLLALGNRGSFRVTPRWIGVHCERVRRTQFGNWWIQCPSRELDTHRSLGSRYLLILIHHLVSASMAPAPHAPTSSSCFCSLKYFAFWRPIFHSPCPKPSFSFSLPIRWLTVSILPFQFPRVNLNGLQNYQSHYSERTLFQVTWGDEGQFMGCVLGPHDHSASN